MPLDRPSLNVVFDVVRDGYHAWWVVGVGLIFVIASGMIAFAPPGRRPQRRRRFEFVSVRSMGWMFLALSLIVTAASTAAQWTQYLDLREAELRGRYAIVEGFVEHFQPTPGGRGPESFDVAGHHYEYWPTPTSPAYHGRDVLTGAPNLKGRYVRLYDVDGDIIHIELNHAL
jgi:hypothetical protein